MTIEDKIFSHMRFDKERMEECGFTNKGPEATLSCDFMGGDFTAELVVHGNGSIRGRVIDNMNEEEYYQLRMPNYTGAFVGTVREEYEKLLREIAARCCNEVAFTSDQANRIADEVMERYSVKPDFPWDDKRYSTAGVFRHANNNKWFGLIMNIDMRLLDKAAEEEYVDVLNLKADESKIEMIHKLRGIYPAYHMNHSKWISVVLDDSLTDSDVMDLIDISFRLTATGGGVLSEALIREVLEVADNIPYGRVVSYGQIAEMIGRPKNARLVGKIMSMADRYGEHPCHRVVNHAGRTVPGWTEQRELLEAEGVEFLGNGRVDMKKYRI